MHAPSKLSDEQIRQEIVSLEGQADEAILGRVYDEVWATIGPRFNALMEEQRERKKHSAVAVVRLRLLAGEGSRSLDAACGEALGWRVDRDPWWNWHEGPVYDPPGDEWCIRKDGRSGLPCDEVLPHFSAESFEATLNSVKPRP